MVAMLITVLAVLVLAAGYYLVLWCLGDRRRYRAEKAIDAPVNRLHWLSEHNPQARTPHNRRDLICDTQSPAGPLPPQALRTGGAAPLSSRPDPARVDSTTLGNVPAGLAGGAGTLPPPATPVRLRPTRAGTRPHVVPRRAG